MGGGLPVLRHALTRGIPSSEQTFSRLLCRRFQMLTTVQEGGWGRRHRVRHLLAESPADPAPGRPRRLRHPQPRGAAGGRLSDPEAHTRPPGVQLRRLQGPAEGAFHPGTSLASAKGCAFSPPPIPSSLPCKHPLSFVLAPAHYPPSATHAAFSS